MKLNPEELSEIKSLIAEQIKEARDIKAPRQQAIQQNKKLYRAEKLYKNDPEAGVYSDAQLGQMNGYIRPFMAQMKTSLRPRYRKITRAQETTAKKLNLFIDYLAQIQNWDLLAQYADRNVALTGRAIFRVVLEERDMRLLSNKQRTPEKEKMPVLELIDPDYFFIDPNVSPLNQDDAAYMGNQGIIYSTWEIKNLFSRGNVNYAKKQGYILDELDSLKDRKYGDAPSHEEQMEMQVKQSFGGQYGKRRLYNCHAWVFDYNGTRLYAEYNENLNKLFRIAKLEDIQGHNMFPYATYAYDGDQTQFWSVGLADLVRDAVILQNLSNNQMVDIAQRTIEPQWFIFGNGGEEVDKLMRYIPSEYIVFDEETRVEPRPMPNISTPMAVYDNVSRTVQMNVGITDSLRGVSSQSAVNINNSDLNRVGDLMRLPFEERTAAYRRIGVLIKKMLENVDKIFIPAQEEKDFTELSAKDIKFDLDVFVETRNVTDGESEPKLRMRMEYVSSLRGSQFVNQKYLETILAQMANLDDDQIRELFSVSDVADPRSAERAAEDFTLIISGDKPRKRARYTTDYLQVFIDMSLEAVDIPKDAQSNIMKHIAMVTPIAMEQMQLEQTLQMQMVAMTQNNGAGQPRQQLRPLRTGDGIDTVPQDKQIQNF
jgi:hypothetical protein